jgi:hypothetical protein
MFLLATCEIIYRVVLYDQKMIWRLCLGILQTELTRKGISKVEEISFIVVGPLSVSEHLL